MNYADNIIYFRNRKDGAVDIYRTGDIDMGMPVTCMKTRDPRPPSLPPPPLRVSS